jgi:phospholipid/cholesterol/gamma-HCH transport system substrate-binding protein
MKIDKELAVGVFLLIGIFSLVYISVRLGKLEVLGHEGYTLYASFENAGGLKSGASVEIAGVKIGTVENVKLNNYQALVGLTIRRNVKIQDDAIASIKTAGLLGEKYVEITPGASDKILRNGGTIRETESAIDIQDLIAKYAFGKV